MCRVVEQCEGGGGGGEADKHKHCSGIESGVKSKEGEP